LGALRRVGRALQFGSGATLLVMGIAVASGQLTRFAIWLLKSFPILGSIG
jgi:cytochrome c-type biogenesis protein